MTPPSSPPGTVDRAVAEAMVRRDIRSDFAAWAKLALPKTQAPAAHHRLLMNALRDICMGRNDRLMVLMPPGSAKSTYASVLFPPWWFLHHPGTNIIAASHTAPLAGAFGGRVRGLISDHAHYLGYHVTAPHARDDFRLSNGGTYFAVGVQGGVTGRRADLILIDDPVKSCGHADSDLERDTLWDWYRSDLLTRLKPRGRIVLIMTRWHPDDIGGRLLDNNDGWRCITLPALAGDDDIMGRARGAALWPEWEDAGALDRKRVQIGERAWAALFQQEPRHEGGHMFGAAEKLSTIDEVAPEAAVRAWDLAATAATDGTDPDWTVGLKMCREATKRFVIADVVRLRGTPHEVEAAIVRTAHADGPGVRISLPQDPGQAGKAQAQYLTGQLAGFRVHATPETGSKTIRAQAIASQVEVGNVALLRGAWNAAFLDELRSFPRGRKDDQIDALSRAFAVLIGQGPGPRIVPANYAAR